MIIGCYLLFSYFFLFATVFAFSFTGTWNWSGYFVLVVATLYDVGCLCNNQYPLTA